MIDKEIEVLKRKRANLRNKVTEYYNKGKDAREIVSKYLEITDQLIQKGFQPKPTFLPYLNIEWWDKWSKSNGSTQNIWEPNGSLTCKDSNKTTICKEIKIKSPEGHINNLVDAQIKKINYYYICLAWSNKESQCASCTINLIRNCFKDLGLTEITNDCYQFGEGAENLIKYRHIGDDDSFQIIKTFAQSILDNSNENSAAVYGKKINF